MNRRGFLGAIVGGLLARKLPKPAAPKVIRGQSASIVLPDGQRVEISNWVDDKLYDTVSFADIKCYSYGLVRRDVA